MEAVVVAAVEAWGSTALTKISHNTEIDLVNEVRDLEVRENSNNTSMRE